MEAVEKNPNDVNLASGPACQQCSILIKLDLLSCVAACACHTQYKCILGKDVFIASLTSTLLLATSATRQCSGCRLVNGCESEGAATLE